MFMCIWENSILLIKKKIHLNKNHYLDGWSTDKGKEHWILVGKQINYANSLAPPPDFLHKLVTNEFPYCHKCLFH